MDDGYHFSVPGNLLNEGEITLNLNASSRTPRMDIAANLINNGEIYLLGNTVFNVAGSVTGSGSFSTSGQQNQVSITQNYTQDGGKVNLGSEIDSFVLKAIAQFYTGSSSSRAQAIWKVGYRPERRDLRPGQLRGRSA